jgi:uncharacterized caspase-like protein
VHFEHGDLQSDVDSKTYSISIPVNLIAGENEIRVYCFNRDDLKSKDASITLTGTEHLRRKGTAFIVAIGINQYSNPAYKLNFAVADAKALADTLGQKMRLLGRYAEVIIIPLLDKDATRENILAGLSRLSHDRQPLPNDAPQSLLKLKSAQPEDIVIVYFAGHGIAKDERYYLIPQDRGFTGTSFKTVSTHCISDQDLEKGFEKIDAGHLLVIIDACQSGQTLEAEEKRRGPMNSRGLAQLAYEKGMYILAAAQKYQAALEVVKLGHGLLTYVLVEDGLAKMRADNRPEDGQITANEWLDYAVQHVPIESKEAMTRMIKQSKPIAVLTEKEIASHQSPRAYYRREAGAQPLIIAKTNGRDTSRTPGQ